MRDDVIAKIAERLALLLGRDASEFQENVKIESLGLKSVNYSQITTFLEDTFDVEISYMEFKRRKTIGEAADYVVELCEE